MKFFKHIIEECDGYLALYYNGKQIAKEKDLQRLFRFVWYGTSYKVDAEPNNGRGQADFIVSKGMNNQNIIEFKLASNSSLGHMRRLIVRMEVWLLSFILQKKKKDLQKKSLKIQGINWLLMNRFF